jgi:prepilin-type N-terminal cleavage/methylation domain-containing protein
MSYSLHVPPLERSSNQRLRAGFTLVEIAIVLVIIGLIIGGLLSGLCRLEDGALVVLQDFQPRGTVRGVVVAHFRHEFQVGQSNATLQESAFKPLRDTL